MFPKIPKSLLNTLEAQQRLFNNPHIQKFQQLTNNFQQFNELRARLESYNLNGIIQQAKLYSLQTQVKFYNPDIQAINLQLQNINLYAKNFEHWNTMINSAINSYDSAQEDKFEIVIENFPVVILKSNLQEYFDKFRKLQIPDSIAFRLSFITYFILEFAPLIYVAPALIPFMQFLLKLFIVYGKPYIKALSKFQDPEIFAEKLADNTFSVSFGLIITLIGTLFINKKK